MSTGQRFLKGLALGFAVIIIVIMFSVAMLFLTVFTDITFENNKHKDKSYDSYYYEDYKYNSRTQNI